MIIDVHTHVFCPEMTKDRNYYCSKDACFDLLYADPKAKLCNVEELLDSMDDSGITRSIVLNIGWVNADLCEKNNDYIIESINKYPGRLTGFCSIQPLEHEKAIKELKRCFRAGIRGVGELRPDIQGYSLTDSKIISPLIEIIRDNNAALSIHASEPVGHDYSGKGDTTPGILHKFIQSYPDINIVLAHFGGGIPFYELMPEVRKTLANTYYDTAAAPFLYTSNIYRSIIDICGSGKLLFGSDWPLLNQSRILKHIDEGCVDNKERERILYSNADRLMNFKN